MIKVLIADDQPLIRSAVKALIEMEKDMRVVAEAASGEDALALCHQHHPDLILMDIRMPRGDGIWATREIMLDITIPATKVLILTTFEEDEYIFEALRAGASGFLGKGTDGLQLTQSIRSVYTGDSLLSPVATRKLIERFTAVVSAQKSSAELSQRLHVLTGRETEILTLVGLGLTNNDIAHQLFISPLTVKTHINRLMAKCHVHDRSQLVIEAYESGLVSPGDNPRP